MPTYSVHREEWNAPQWLKGICIMDHTLWLSAIERQIIGFQEDWVNVHQEIASETPSSPPCNCFTSNDHLGTNEDSFNHRSENVTSSLFYQEGGFTNVQQEHWMEESTLECSSPIFSLHTWFKVEGARGCWRHCSFSRDKMVHSRP